MDVKTEGAVGGEVGVGSEAEIGVDVAEEEVFKLSMGTYAGGEVDEEKSGMSTSWLM